MRRLFASLLPIVRWLAFTVLLGTLPVWAQQNTDLLIPIKTPQGFVIQAELADTPLKRARGLMYRESLPDDRGMLFIFGEAQAWTFWMKNTKIPLDILWLNEQKQIVHIESNVPICTLTGDACPQYQSNQPAMYVLELRGGRATALKLTRGTKLQF